MEDSETLTGNVTIATSADERLALAPWAVPPRGELGAAENWPLGPRRNGAVESVQINLEAGIEAAIQRNRLKLQRIEKLKTCGVTAAGRKFHRLLQHYGFRHSEHLQQFLHLP